MDRRTLARSAGGLLLGTAVVRAADAQIEIRHPHRIALHVASGDRATMEMALHHIDNVVSYYAARHETVAFELVAVGPGYAMLRSDISPVKEMIAETHAKYPSVVFASCQNSREGAAKREGKTVGQIPELPEATPVPAGIGRLNDLQEQGWSYIRV
jgi:intracellular sulfur oxidation DsrE/DsrF family protein